MPLRGAAVLINAFNFPVWGFAEKAACALLAGMPVVEKPGTPTAMVAALLEEGNRKVRQVEGVRSFLAYKIKSKIIRPILEVHFN